MKKPLTIIILAAGKGTRMKSACPKVLHCVAHKPVLEWVLDAAESLEPEQIITVIGPEMPDVKKLASRHDVAVQQQQNGTADAVSSAMPLIKNKSAKVLILLGDEPFVPVDILHQMISEDYPVVMGLYVMDPYGLGRMVLSTGGHLDKIIEEKDASDSEKDIALCNAGNFCLDYHDLEDWLPQITPKNAQKEFYLTDLVSIARQNGTQFQVVSYDAPHVWGINDRIQLAEHERFIQDGLRLSAMRGGVTMIDPASVYLAADTVFGQDVTVEPNVVLGPGVEIGSDTIIKTGCRLEGVKIGEKCEIGPFAQLHPKTEIKDKVILGNFVEVKKSLIHEGVKAKHHAYIANAEIGKNSNFACGAITVNYDGFSKHPTKIGENVMVGSNVNLVAPIEVGDDAFIGAGTTVTENIPSGALALERGKADIREGWVAKYREMKGKKT